MKRIDRIQVSSFMIEDIRAFRKSRKITQHELSDMVKAPYLDYIMNLENRKIFSVTGEELSNINDVRQKSYLPDADFVEDLNDEALLYLEKVIKKKREREA